MNAKVKTANEILGLDLNCSIRSYLGFLEDGAALAEAGFTDEDQSKVEEAHALLTGK